MSKRNPPWSRDELILALNLYMAHRDKLPDVNSPQIAGLSATLRQMSASTNASQKDFRNGNGVYLKLNNFRALDPAYRKDGKVGMTHGAKGDKLVWDRFSDSVSELSAVATAITAGLLEGVPAVPPDDMVEGEEGKLLTRLHVYRERDTALAKKKKKAALAAHGQLVCEACSFNFEKVYGDRGSGYIECHHRLPLHTLTGSKKQVLDDFALLCANCHRMIHAKSPWLTVEELRKILLDKS